MGKRNIIWSQNATRKLLQIMEFYAARNKSKVYSIKLYKRLREKLLMLKAQPEMGIKTEIKNIRGLIVDNYILFYEIDNQKIIVHTPWDCRQNPDDLQILR